MLILVKPGDLMYCLARTEEVLPIALARPYIEQYVPKQTKVYAHMQGIIIDSRLSILSQD